jgi:hypothetical protein
MIHILLLIALLATGGGIAFAQTSVSVSKSGDKQIEMTITSVEKKNIPLKELYSRREVLQVQASMINARITELDKLIQDSESLGVTK